MRENFPDKKSDPFAEEEIAALLEWLDLGDGPEWEAAARSLYLRYYEWLFRRLYKPLKDTGNIEDVVIKTFRKAIRHIGKFDRRDGEDVDDTRARFEGWLLKIGKYAAYDELRVPVPAQTRDTVFWNTVAADMAGPTAEAPSSSVVDAAREVLAEFSEREQVILRAWLQHCPDFLNPQSKFPRDVLKELSDSLNTNKPNIRTIKKRALARFKTKLKDRGISI